MSEEPPVRVGLWRGDLLLLEGVLSTGADWLPYDKLGAGEYRVTRNGTEWYTFVKGAVTSAPPALDVERVPRLREWAQKHAMLRDNGSIPNDILHLLARLEPDR